MYVYSSTNSLYLPKLRARLSMCQFLSMTVQIILNIWHKFPAKLCKFMWESILGVCMYVCMYRCVEFSCIARIKITSTHLEGCNKVMTLRFWFTLRFKLLRNFYELISDRKYGHFLPEFERIVLMHSLRTSSFTYKIYL